MASSKKYLGKSDIIGAEDRETTEVEVPEWGGAVRLMAPSSWEMSEMRNRQFKLEVGKDGKPQTRVDTTGGNAHLAALCIVDEKGNRIFSANEVRVLGQKSHRALERVVQTINDMDSMEEAIEEIEGNSEATGADSGSSA